MNTKIDRLNPEPSCKSSSWIRKPGPWKPKQKEQSESSSRIRKTWQQKLKQKKPSCESSSQNWKPWPRKPKQKKPAVKAQAELESQAAKAKAEKTKLPYENSSRFENSHCESPSRKNSAVKAQAELQAEKPELRKLKPIKEAKVNKQDMAGALESQPNAFWVCWQGRRCYERQRKGFWSNLYCFSGFRVKFAKFSCQNCAKIVLSQVSSQAKSCAYAAIPSCSSISSITCLEKASKEQFSRSSGLKEFCKIYARNVSLKYMQGYLSYTLNMHWHTIICICMHNNEECTRTCCCRACGNGTATASNRPSWNASGRSMHKYAKNMRLYVKNMHKICIYIYIYIDCISQIWKRYARNMPEICLNMRVLCHYVQFYTPNMQETCKYIDCISQICKYMLKYAGYMLSMCRFMPTIYKKYAKIYTSM